MRTSIRSRTKRWLLTAVGMGALLQTGACIDAESQQAIFETVLLPQISNIVSDAVFFGLDNLLVRLTV